MDTKLNVTGIHHVAAIGTKARQSYDFYAGILGLRLIKQTVKLDEPRIAQLVFGDEQGSPENTLSVFPHQGIKQGRHGTGMVNTTAFSVPLEAMDFWMNRLDRFQVPYKNPQQRFGEEVFLYFEDRDGLGLELVFTENDLRKGFRGGDIPEEKAIRGFHHVEVWERSYARLEGLLLQQLDHQLIAEKGHRRRYAVADKPGKYVDVLSVSDAPKGLKGFGTIHRMAWTSPTVDTLFTVREKLQTAGLEPSFIIDKKYFQSVYFDTSTGIGLEISTADPGWTIDESVEELGTKLKLPLQFEWQREELENNLPSISLKKDF